ncbi:unnamed protein product [Orchesella dallaii]|uniref:Amino acid transporter transmembrane domain-containing protein n=1 Tax=Orchesella dallaii TaxID=48710 RepID=A0ABP1QBP0_9HEXA
MGDENNQTEAEVKQNEDSTESLGVVPDYIDDEGNGPLILNDGNEVEHCDGVDSDFYSSNSRNGSGEGGDNGGTSPIAASMMIVNAALGAGLLNFPSAFHEAGGVVAANLVQLALLMFIYPALLILAYCSDWNKSKTLQEVLSFVWGRRAERATALCIAVYCFGTCITFLIIIGDQYDRVFASLYGHYFCHQWFMNRTFTTVVTAVLFILPFCYPKKIDFLKHISSVGVLAVIYVTILIIVQYYKGEYVPGEIKTRPTAWTDTFLVVPTLCFGYQCHVSVIPIYSCFKKRNLKNFAGSTLLALSICVFTYTVAATYGYLTFGSNISSDILQSYDARDPYILIAIIAISIKTYTTYPILCFCGNAAVSDLWVDSRAAQGVLEVDPRIKERFRLVSVTIWFILTLIVAVVLPNIGSVIHLLGSLAAVFIFVFPGLCLLKMSETPNGEMNRLTKPRTSFQFLAALFLAVGSFLFGVVLTNAIVYDFIYVKPEPMPLCIPK